MSMNNNLMRRKLCLTGFLLVAFLSVAGEVGASDRPIDFERDVRPILSGRCFKCHGPDEASRKAGLRLDVRTGATKKRKKGFAIQPGSPEASELMRRVTAADSEERMPPVGDALTDGEVEALRSLIAAGAEYPEHWAYRRPRKAPLPAVPDSDWPVNAIDRFILARLGAEGLTPSREARPAILLRRVTLDLTGLPPTIEQVDEFLEDPSPEAYKAAVDRLLSSPRFGEKWASRWLDLARYADSNGYHHDDLRSVWPYRDWVIEAFNSDKPFDQFTIEQIAGDLLPGATLDQRIATGFHRNSAANLAGGSKIDEIRAALMFDRVNTTGVVWLGATLECAQCHNHKFDPISTKEYYQLFAFYNNDVAEVERDPSSKKLIRGAMAELPVSPRRRSGFERLKGKHDVLKTKLDAATAKALSGIAEWESTVDRASLPNNVRAILRSSRRATRNDVATKQVEQYFLGLQHDVVDLKARLKPVAAALEKVRPPTTLVLSRRMEPRTTRIYMRGSYTSPGEVVGPEVPATWHAFDANLPRNRLGLARWLTAPDNPLTARVTVNRWWEEVFGRGLVTTTDDFGLQGELPTHPGLLDWLAVEFIERGWSMKHMIKLMVMSSTYRQSSDSDQARLSADPDNTLYSRGPRFRLPAEAIRDNALAIGGLLAHRLGGPSVHPPQPDKLWREISGIVDPNYPTSMGRDRYRRGVYVILRRGAPFPSLINFDAPSRAVCTSSRVRTNSPLQALNLLNDPVFVEAAEGLARRIMTGRPHAALRERARYAFRLCVAREPDQQEIDAALGVYETMLNRLQSNPAMTSELLTAGAVPSGIDAGELAAWFFVANTLLNLDETVTKR
jgi:hypothetical protein